jgi:hypothetical protein
VNPDSGTEPLVRVVKGDSTPEELAAVTAVIAAKLAARAEQPASADRVSDWSSYWRAVRAPAQHGPGRWRASALPR